jgi:predicted nuclease of predicted toxin-antitoxin system
LLDANMPRSSLALLLRYGHSADHAKDLGLGDAPDGAIAARVRAEGAVLVTRDLDFADIRGYPPQDGPGILVFRVPDHWTAAHIVAPLDRFPSTESLAERLPGHLAILDRPQVRFRPALG